MTKNPSKKFGAKVAVVEDGKTQYMPDGKPRMTVIQMGPGILPNGQLQPFYDAGVFKGMTVLLKERGLVDEAELRAECPKFKCKNGATSCCQRHVLYNQPDFRDQKSALEIACNE